MKFKKKKRYKDKFSVHITEHVLFRLFTVIFGITDWLLLWFLTLSDA